MSYPVSGKIKRKSVKDGRVSFLIADKWYSAFTVGKFVTQEFQDTMRNLMEGDSVDLQIEDKQGKDGRTYSNIMGAVKVTNVRDEEPEPVQSSGQPTHRDSKDSRDEMMRTSYCKDIMIAFPKESEAELLGRVAMVKNMARLMGE